MRDRWKPFAAVLVVGASAALAIVATSHAAITITSLQARASGSSITSGPMGSGYDIRIVANVTDGTSWESTRWTTGGVTRCVNHTDRGNGSQTVDLDYQYEANPTLKEGVLPDPDKVGPSEHVFPPPPGGASTLRVELFTNDSCSGSGLANQSISLTTDVPATNKPLTAQCQGLKVAVILDESGSIASAGATQQVKDGTKALAQGLVDTGARMAVFKFSSTADPSFIAPYKTITQAWIDGNSQGDLKYYLDRYDPGGATNWDSGLAQARDLTASDKPDLVVFLTDGNPNRWAGGGTGVEEGYYSAMNPAANVANQLKANSHMFAIGVGQGVTDALSALRLQAVSGTRTFPEYPISIADYTLVTDFSQLEQALEDLASNLCNVTVTVRKETDEQVRDAWISKSGWSFSGRVAVQPPAAPFSYSWYEPNAVDPVDAATATQSGVTRSDGTLRFVWRPRAATSLSDITISETVPPAYIADSVTCTSAGNTIFFSDVPATVVSFSLQGLKVRDSIYCNVRNHLKRSTVQVVKQWVGDPASATIFVDANGSSPFDASTIATASGQSTAFDYPVSTSVRVGETAVPAGYTATIDCGQGLQAYSGGPFPVTSPPEDGATLTCTITNRQLRSTVQVVKQWVGAPSSATLFVDGNGVFPYDASTVATANGDSTSFTYPISSSVTVGEVAVPPGYEATIHCGAGPTDPLPYDGGPFPVTAPPVDGATLTCTITNVQETSHVRVVKNWVGTPSSATIFVDVDGTAPFDASTVATTTGASAAFTYPLSTPVTVGETAVPTGYAATIRCGNETPQPYSGGGHAVTSPAVGGATVTCVITNTQLLSKVQVVKEWVGAAGTTTIFVDATGALPFDASTVATASGASATFEYPVSTAVTVGETAIPAGYAAEIQCGDAAPQPYDGLPFPVTSPSVDGATITCTITNSQQLSTIRVVKNWFVNPGSVEIFVDANGVAPFDARTIATADGHNASFTYPVNTPAFVGETGVPTGYTATIQCGAAAPQAYGGTPFPVTSPAVNGETLTCTISNNEIPPPATVRVVKDWIGAPTSATIFVDDGVGTRDASTIATADGDNTSFDYVAGTPVFVGEETVPTGYSATIQCGGAPAQDYAGGPFPVVAPAAGATLTCTITNKRLLSTVRVVKQWVGVPATAEIFVDANGTAPYDAATTATTSGASTLFVYPVSSQVTVGETTVPAGYEATISCGALQGRQAYNGGPFPVTSPAQHGAVITCTITNTQQISYVRVVKQWVGGQGSAEIFVDADGAAPYDASTIATTSGAETFFPYPVSTPVTVGETTIPPGFGAKVSCGALQGRQAYNGGPFPVTSPAQHGAVITCTITNTQLFSTVRVVKQWVGTPASAEIFVDADGAAPYQASTVATADGDSASFDYPVSTPVTVGETAVPAGYAATIDCGAGPQAYTGGPFPVTSPAGGSEVVTCTITNRELRSTVQVVKDWAGAPSSATLFVDANGLAPYDASTVATASGDSTSFSYPVSTPVTLGETGVPLGYRATIDCGAGQQQYTGGPFPVTSPAVDGATLTCTITNTPTTTVRVVKQWAGRPGSTEIFVDAVGRTPFDVSTVAENDGESASFDYAPSSQVTLGEIAVPPGYVALINCGDGIRSIRRYAGGPLAVMSPSTPNGVLTCTVANVRRLGPVGRLVIVKTANRKAVRAPGQVRFGITVRNGGTGTARAVRVCDRLPAGMVLVRAPGARRVGGELCWQISRLGPRAKRSFTVLVRVVGPNRRRILVNFVDVTGTNTINCRSRVLASRQQRSVCRDSARVVVLPARRAGALPISARVRFTG